MISVTRRLEFDAGHRIPDHRSQCRNLHGHRYVLELTLTGDVVQAPGQSDNGMVMDFSDIKHIAKRIWSISGTMLFWSMKAMPPYAIFWPPCPITRP
ncbi:6-pyruvoyl tetrahydropterin synthase family protein [Bordetella holmesii 70147]|nr:6-pyruvoyl tetrahydropterin synthase family protein [Bordetella holmesii 70147]